MQLFFLLCTMLIIISEAFSAKLYGSHISKSIKRGTSRFATKFNHPNPGRYIFRHLNFPMFLVPPSYDSPDYEVQFFAPLVRRRVKPKSRKTSFSRKNKRFSNRERLRKKYLKKSKWNPVSSINVPNSLSSSQTFGDVWTSGPELHVQPHWNLTNFFRDVFGSRNFLIRNPNQYIVCLYPVFIRPNERTIDVLKKRRFLNMKRQYLNKMRNKNKRSANNKDVSPQDRKFGEEGSKSDNENIDSIESPSAWFNPTTDKSASERFENEGSEDDQNMYAYKSSFESPNDFAFNLYDNLEANSGENFLFPPPLDLATDMYTTYLDVTEPSVTVPKITFKYPYDPKLYESSLRSDSIDGQRARKETSTEENLKRNAESNSPRDSGKLRQMLQELESMLKFENEDNMELTGNSLDEGGKKEKEEIDSSGKQNDTITLKEKIDSVAIPILAQISQDLGKMTNVTNVTSDSSSTEGGKSQSKLSRMRCSADGTWTSSALGLEMTFTTMPNMMLKVKITSKNNAVISEKWSIQGLTLSKRGGPLMLAAIYPQKRKIASFIGQCKMCRDQDLIFGSWTIYTCVRRFTDLWKAVETKLDILKKKREK